MNNDEINNTQDLINKINKLQREKRKFKTENNREPSLEEISNILNVSTQGIIDLQKTIDDLNKGSYEYLDCKRKNPDIPENKEEYDILIKKIQDNMYLLNDREKEVIKLRFGLIDGKNWTLDEIGKKLNMKTERVRQVVAKGLRYVRNPERVLKLKEVKKMMN